jgi:hypothetical protein
MPRRRWLATWHVARGVVFCTLAPISASPPQSRAQSPAQLPAQSPAQSPPQSRDSISVVTVAPGVSWRRVVRPAGPWVINIATIDLRGRGYDLRHVRARDSLRGKEKLSSIVARAPEGAARVVVAVNADFFNVQTGESENNQVISGEWWKGVRVADSPFDTFPNVRTQFAVDTAQHPLLDKFQFDGVAIHSGGTLPLIGLNFLARGGPEATAFYTARLGITPLDTVRTVAEAPLARVGARGDTAVFVRRGPVEKSGGHRVPAGGATLAGYGARADAVAKLADGDTVRILIRAKTPTAAYPSLALLIGGWPRILRNGENIAGRSASDEATLSRNAEVRHPRSAVGFSRDSSTLILATVDGRQATSAGMTIVELAALMREFGAWDALNFDGGGSTTMVIQGRVVNSPADPTGEREIANGLLIVRRAP